ncbi:MAG: Crp/Fnr family transcriptional regulator [Eubacteriales bacterium]
MLQCQKEFNIFLERLDLTMNKNLDFPEEWWLPMVENRPVLRYPSGYFIYQQECQANCFYYLKSGKVKSFIQSEEGQERVLHIYHSGAIFGEAAFFDELPRLSSALTLEKCEVISLDKTLVEIAFEKNPKLALSMMKYLARTIRILSSQVDDMAFHPAPQRVARYLLAHRNETDTLSITQEEIAYSVSTSRVTVSRVMKNFAIQNWIATSYREIKIINLTELEEFSLSGSPKFLK